VPDAELALQLDEARSAAFGQQRQCGRRPPVVKESDQLFG
jgi:hypothetical protein